jgi:hypothetical protein
MVTLGCPCKILLLSLLPRKNSAIYAEYYMLNAERRLYDAHGILPPAFGVLPK